MARSRHFGNGELEGLLGALPSPRYQSSLQLGELGHEALPQDWATGFWYLCPEAGEEEKKKSGPDFVEQVHTGFSEHVLGSRGVGLRVLALPLNSVRILAMDVLALNLSVPSLVRWRPLFVFNLRVG